VVIDLNIGNNEGTQERVPFLVPFRQGSTIDREKKFLFNSVILSGIGANATMKSKDPEDADCNQVASGNSLET
jgi:hypothetical protein